MEVINKDVFVRQVFLSIVMFMVWCKFDRFGH